MFDITSSKLLILAIVALIVVGPKDLPILLRTLAKYMGVIRHHANEFRAQLDEALREAELDELKKEFDSVGREMKGAIEQGGRAIDSNVESARREVDSALEGAPSQTAARGEAGSKPAKLPEPATQPAPAKPQRPEKTGT